VGTEALELDVVSTGEFPVAELSVVLMAGDPPYTYGVENEATELLEPVTGELPVDVLPVTETVDDSMEVLVVDVARVDGAELVDET